MRFNDKDLSISDVEEKNEGINDNLYQLAVAQSKALRKLNESLKH